MKPGAQAGANAGKRPTVDRVDMNGFRLHLPFDVLGRAVLAALELLNAFL